ncbi:hypothetical protein BSKO_07236 [Bryopsis sp. KO-2023]|nr:hypothetical protein BSKO_07236 [Bryopsis sp. KO-2023]
MVLGKNERRKEDLKARVRYHKLKLTPSFEKQLEKRKKQLEDKVFHLQVMAHDCQSWKTTDLSEARRGIEVSILKYRLAKELGQQARAVLDDILDEVRPYILDPHGLEEEVWKYFEGDSSALYDQERVEAEAKLEESGFVLRRMYDRDPTRPDDGASASGSDDDHRMLEEASRVRQETRLLLQKLEEKRSELINLRRGSVVS